MNNLTIAIIKPDAIKNNLVDAIVCTGALIEQDMLFALGHTHYKCTPHLNDGDLQNLGIDRVYDHLVDEMAMQQIDLTFKQIADDLPPGRYSSRTFLQNVGKWLSECNNNYYGGTLVFARETNDNHYR